MPTPLPPEDALAIGQQVHTGLQHMHQRGWGHCDVKAPNIFVAADGSAVLGDYGAARKLGNDADEKTMSHIAVDLPAAFQVDKASVQLDEYLLAVTLLEKLGLLQLGAQELKMAVVMQAVGQISSVDLLDFISLLLKYAQ
jgi:serine/threonine protein kinase